jgi:UDP-N-acetylglucosamine--N-acetylmuramyl-(pentapeptide) pyrophosphoryl-undecaprenol N-acetylglucosamine transferase
MKTGPIMIMAGGTGGHVFPGLAVAAELRARHNDVVWLGTQRGLEARVVPQNGIDVEWISIAGVRGRGVGAWLSAPVRIVGAVAQALAAMRRQRPAAVLGLGGFVSGPGGLAAWLTRRPLLIHEQNSVAGTTNRWLAPLAARVFEAFPNTFAKSVGAEFVGNPVRREFVSTDSPRERLLARANVRRRLFVLGGSQGARVLNDTLPQALALLPESKRPEVLHQAGANNIEAARGAYAAAGVQATVEAFIQDMPSAYRWADLVVARAGALTVTELAHVGVGAILVPLPTAIDDHQTSNALHFVSRGGGVLMPQRELTAASLAAELAKRLADLHGLAQMAEAARAQAMLAAAERIAAACVAAAESRS